jgi:hypothetical protein
LATIIPANVESFTTEGEMQSYRFLEAVAKPDGQYLCWYLPDIRGKKPDFILFSNDLGLVVLEVKDWNLIQIRAANPHFFIIEKGSKTEQHQNPYQQARDYLIQLIEAIKGDKRLVSKDPFHRGNPKIPINCGVIFPNINKYEYIQKGFDRVIGEENIFFWDDLHPESPICCDSTGICFAKTVENMFPVKFSFNLTGVEPNHLKQLIFPVVKIELPDRKTERSYTRRISRLKSLDNHQEALVRKFDGGHRIIVGPSGSGKTLILVHKAAFLMQYNPDIKNILFVCFNITLVNYIKRLLADKGVTLDDNQDIYQRESLWKDVGIQARGRVHRISYIYRNTKEISEFASKFIKETDPTPDVQKAEQLELFPNFFDFSGPRPVIKRFSDYESIISNISDKIHETVSTDECPCSEIAIIFTMKMPDANMKEPLPLMVKKALESNGILSNWALEDYRSKTTYDITTNSVTISTIHSVKGLDYSCVFLLGLDSLKPKGWTEDQINNLVYVAITRARYQLLILYIHKSSLIKRLKRC